MDDYIEHVLNPFDTKPVCHPCRPTSRTYLAHYRWSRVYNVPSTGLLLRIDWKHPNTAITSYSYTSSQDIYSTGSSTAATGFDIDLHGGGRIVASGIRLEYTGKPDDKEGYLVHARQVRYDGSLTQNETESLMSESVLLNQPESCYSSDLHKTIVYLPEGENHADFGNARSENASYHTIPVYDWVGIFGMSSIRPIRVVYCCTFEYYPDHNKMWEVVAVGEPALLGKSWSPMAVLDKLVDRLKDPVGDLMEALGEITVDALIRFARNHGIHEHTVRDILRSTKNDVAKAFKYIKKLI